MESLFVFVYFLGFLFGYENYQKKYNRTNGKYTVGEIVEI